MKAVELKDALSAAVDAVVARAGEHDALFVAIVPDSGVVHMMTNGPVSMADHQQMIITLIQAMLDNAHEKRPEFLPLMRAEIARFVGDALTYQPQGGPDARPH